MALFNGTSREKIENICKWIEGFEGTGSIDLQKEDSTGMATICINNVKKRNALSGPMMSAISRALTELENWHEGKVVLIHGADGFFCSGIDLTFVRKLVDDSEKATLMSILMRDNLRRLSRLPMLSVALIEGKALGGGAELTTACDLRLMAPDSEIGFVHVKMGISFAFGGGVRLVRLLGSTQALHILATGRRVGAVEALQVGLVNGLLSSSSSTGTSPVNGVKEATQWVGRYMRNTPSSIEHIKGEVVCKEKIQSNGSTK